MCFIWTGVTCVSRLRHTNPFYLLNQFRGGGAGCALIRTVNILEINILNLGSQHMTATLPSWRAQMGLAAWSRRIHTDQPKRSRGAGKHPPHRWAYHWEDWGVGWGGGCPTGAGSVCTAASGTRWASASSCSPAHFPLPFGMRASAAPLAPHPSYTHLTASPWTLPVRARGKGVGYSGWTGAQPPAPRHAQTAVVTARPFDVGTPVLSFLQRQLCDAPLGPVMSPCGSAGSASLSAFKPA